MSRAPSRVILMRAETIRHGAGACAERPPHRRHAKPARGAQRRRSRLPPLRMPSSTDSVRLPFRTRSCRRHRPRRSARRPGPRALRTSRGPASGSRRRCGGRRSGTPCPRRGPRTRRGACGSSSMPITAAAIGVLAAAAEHGDEAEGGEDPGCEAGRLGQCGAARRADEEERRHDAAAAARLEGQRVVATILNRNAERERRWRCPASDGLDDVACPRPAYCRPRRRSRRARAPRLPPPRRR